MGFFDDAKSMFDRGAAAAERTTRTARLKMQINDIASKRKELAAQLGASLYDTVRDDKVLRVGRESIIDTIAELDEQRAAAEMEIAAIEAQAAESIDAATTYTCPKCGARVYGRQSFCSGCGLPIAEIKASAAEFEPDPIEASGVRCANCGGPMDEADLFCMNCGAKREPEGQSPAEAEVSYGEMQRENVCEYPPDYNAE